MNITVLTIGSRGDLQPCVALGCGLQSAGHRVKLATHTPYRSFVRQHGLEFAPLSGDPQQIVQSELGLQMVESGRNPVRNLQAIRNVMREEMAQAGEEVLAACAGADLVLYSTLAFIGWHVAEYYGIPAFSIPLQPVTRSSEQPSMWVPAHWRLPRLLNRLSHQVAEQLLWQPLRDVTNQWRQERLGLAPLPFWGPFPAMLKKEEPVIYGYSPLVAPPPADWHPHVHVTGYWFLDQAEDWEPPANLLGFLQEGPPPVYVGFGSMGNRNPRLLTTIVLEAVRLAGERAVLLRGWGGLGDADLPDHVCRVDYAPHDWLFPRVATVVHHGGAGTTAAGLRAGVPSVLVPFFGDQFFWGQRVAALGVGPQPLPRWTLTAKRLALAIHQAVTDQTMRDRAAALGRAIRRERGVANAVSAIEQEMERVSSA